MIVNPGITAMDQVRVTFTGRLVWPWQRAELLNIATHVIVVLTVAL